MSEERRSCGWAKPILGLTSWVSDDRPSALSSCFLAALVAALGPLMLLWRPMEAVELKGRAILEREVVARDDMILFEVEARKGQLKLFNA